MGQKRTKLDETLRKKNEMGQNGMKWVETGLNGIKTGRIGTKN